MSHDIMLADLNFDSFFPQLDIGMHAHLDWSSEFLRSAVLRTRPAEIFLRSDAHIVSALGNWFINNLHNFIAIDRPRAELMETQHRELHNVVRTICMDLCNGFGAAREDFEIFEASQRAFIDHLSYFQNLVLRRAFQVDALTNLPLRCSMEKDFDLLTKCTRQRGVVGLLMMVDVDNFKDVNDSHGHAGGDIVLRQIACTLKQVLRENDLVYRYGGEEFVLMMELPVTTHAEATAAERVLVAIRNLSIDVGGSKISPTVTIGVASASFDENLASLIKRADHAMYIGKAAGRNCYKIADRAFAP